MVNSWSSVNQRRTGKPLAPATVNLTYGTLRAAFAYAATSGLVIQSPCHDVKLPRKVRKVCTIVGPEDVQALAKAIDVRYSAMVWVGALLGLRWGEVAALRVEDLDLVGGQLEVRRTITRDEHGRPLIGPPKSEAGNPTLSMPVVLGKLLAGHLATSGRDEADDDALVFPAPDGSHWSYANFRRRIWLPAVRTAGLGGVGFHDLRRTATTQLVLSNVDIKTAGTRLGHSDVRLTLEVYAQATTEADCAAAEGVATRFAKFLPVMSPIEDLDEISMEPLLA